MGRGRSRTPKPSQVPSIGKGFLIMYHQSRHGGGGGGAGGVTGLSLYVTKKRFLVRTVEGKVATQLGSYVAT